MKKRVRKKKLKKGIKLLFIVLVTVLCLESYFIISNSSFFEKKVSTKNVDNDKKKDIYPKEYNASMIMVGDALIHSCVYEDAEKDDGTYDFKGMLSLTKPITTKYDLAYYNQETILGGSELGLSSYPQFNSPTEVGDAFIDSGFNLVSLATNHTMDKGETGVLKSLDYWKTKKNVYTAGSYSSFEDRDKAVIKEINGIKYSLLSYTTWTNGLTPPDGKEYLDNVYNEELVKADIERVRDKCDVVIVAMHWGTEYSQDVSSSQEEIANYLSNLGVDIIIGSHPHVIEPVEYINDGKTFVIYSLGNYISDQNGVERLSGLMMSLNIKKVVNEDKTSTISIESPKAELIYTKSNTCKNFKVYPYKDLSEDILSGYKDYYNEYSSILKSRYHDLNIVGLE